MNPADVASAVPVAVKGVGNTGLTLTGLAAWGTFLVALAAVIRAWAPLRKIRLEADGKLIDTLTARVSKLEQTIEDERTRHETEVSLLRHRANNSDQCIDALLMLMENADDLPERVKRAIASVREMRNRQKQEEALEKGAIKGARAATKPVEEAA